ncbi:MAG: hypothetical protein IPO63_09735 [Bacteroidetes bacterium]|nr:hypothetical protein [Bacteroidota bacterium]
MRLDRKHLLSTLLFGAAVIHSQYAIAQQEMVEDNGINAFRNTININCQTTTTIAPRSFEFQIRHRFGSLKPDKSIITDFFGFDATANIQFIFDMALGKNNMITVGRLKTDKTFKLGIKRVFLKQVEDNITPISLSVYSDVSIKTTPFNKIPPYTFFEDSVTPFKNKFAHRLQYLSQLIISKNVNGLLSLQLSPTLIYQNLVDINESNLSFAIPFSAAIKTGIFTSIIFEYSYLINYKTENELYPLSIGLEFGTAGHVFQIIASSTAGLSETEIYSSSPLNYNRGEFLLGFNIRRTFVKKLKTKTPTN